MWLLYCDAGPGIGVGHLMRCLAIARAVRAIGRPVTLAGTIDGEFAQAELATAGIPHVSMDAKQQLVSTAVETGAVLVHVDHYGEFPRLRQRLNASGILLSSIEDGDFGRRPADLVVDPNLGAESSPRECDGSSMIARGLRWAPIRDDVASTGWARGASVGEQTDRRVLVVMGGTDACGAIVPVAEGLARCRVPVVVTVIAPPQRSAEVRAVLPSAHVMAPTGELPNLAANSDLVVTAAGSSLWELACIGVPMAIVAVTDNQKEGYRRAVAAGLGSGLGSLEEIRGSATSLADRLDELLADPHRLIHMARLASRMCDGKGAKRIAGLWETMTC